MSPLDEIPAPWRDAMEKAGAYSIRDLAARTGTGPSTVSDLVHGRKRTSERTLQAVAAALRVPVTTIREWAQQARGELGPWNPPAAAAQLSNRQRRALDDLIRAIVAPATAEERPKAVKPAGELVDLARPPQPDLSRVAARRGKSEGRRLREQQDQQTDD